MSLFVRAASVVALAASLVASSASAQSEGPVSLTRPLSFDIGGGVMRFGPHAMLGLEWRTTRLPFSLRADALLASSAHETPGGSFGAAGLSAVLPLWRDARLSPYLLGGASTTFSRHLDPEVRPAIGAGLRFRLGGVSAFVDARTMHRGGVPLSIGLRF